MKLGYPVKWDAARRSYILITGHFKRTWVIKYLSDKVKDAMKNSEVCAKCKCELPIDAVEKDTFFYYVVIDGQNKEDVEECDSYIFAQILKELESLGIKHRLSRLSYPPGQFEIVNVSEEENASG